MNSKYIKYTEGNPPHWSNVIDRILFHYFEFVTSLFTVDYSDDERNSINRLNNETSLTD